MIVIDIDMPSTCTECPMLAMQYYGRHNYMCKAIKKNKFLSYQSANLEGRPKRCPIKPLEGEEE